jgi:hypothetical protein
MSPDFRKIDVLLEKSAREAKRRPSPFGAGGCSFPLLGLSFFVPSPGLAARGGGGGGGEERVE